MTGTQTPPDVVQRATYDGVFGFCFGLCDLEGCGQRLRQRMNYLNRTVVHGLVRTDKGSKLHLKLGRRRTRRLDTARNL
jgi:hypothetical protein